MSHECKLPLDADFREITKCDECGTNYICIGHGDGVLTPEWPIWKKTWLSDLCPMFLRQLLG